MKLKKMIESYNEKIKDFKNLKNVFSKNIINQFSKNMVKYIFNNLPKSKQVLMSQAGANAFKDTIEDFFNKILKQSNVLESYLLAIFKTHIRKNIPFEDFSLTYGKFLLDIIDYYTNKENSFSNKEKKEYIEFIKLLIIIYLFFVLNSLKIEEKGKIDPLTGVYAKNYFFYNYKSLIDTYKVGIFFDIKNFKETNLFYGYSVGDTILSIFSSNLQNKFNNSQSTIIRYGSDDFLIFTNDSIEVVLEKIKEIKKICSYKI